jgi:hypothetical protein
MKGQGGSFGYPLMTAVGNSLCRFLEKVDKLPDSALEVVAVHVDTMRVVISNKMEGEGGKMGDRLLNGLDLVVNKVLKKNGDNGSE